MSADLSKVEDSSMIEVEDLSKVEDSSEIEDLSKVEDSSMIEDLSETDDYSETEDYVNTCKTSLRDQIMLMDHLRTYCIVIRLCLCPFCQVVCRGQTRLFWNLEQYPIPESAEIADLVSFHRNIKLALHRLGIHGWLEIWAYGDKPNHDELDLDKANITYIEPRGQMSIARQMSVDILFFAATLPDRTAFVVMAKQNPEIEGLKRVLECLQLRYHHPVVIVEPPADTAQDGLFQSADSVFDRSQFVGGGKTRPRFSASKRIRPVQVAEAGVFWDAEDCPFLVASSPDTIYKKFRSALIESDLIGNMSIWAYVDEKKESWGEFLRKKTWKSRIHFLPGGDKPARLERMLQDILLWLIEHPYRADLIVFADKLRYDDKEFFDILLVLESRGYRVFLLTLSKDTGPESPEWPELLLDQGYAFGFETEAESPQPKKHKAGEGSGDQG